MTTEEEIQENLEILDLCGPPTHTRIRALEGEYVSWRTEGDDFASWVHALEELKRLLGYEKPYTLPLTKD